MTTIDSTINDQPPPQWSQPTPCVRPDCTMDGDEIANLAAAACFEWISDAIDQDGNEHGSAADEEAEWVQHFDEVEIDLSAFDHGANECGVPPTLTAELTAHWISGNDCTIKVFLRQTGFRRGGDQPIATYWVKGWKHA